MNIYDPIRRRQLAATPEEVVRQSLLERMIHQLHYPKGLLAVEKKLRQGRRFDIVCYSRHAQHGLMPLLVIECKAEDVFNQALEQVLGYNMSLGAPFLCIASKTQIRTLWLNQGKIESVPFLPSYDELIKGFHDAGH